jgi:hypothetical protein
VNNRFAWGPDFEWRHADVNNGSLGSVSGLGSGDWYTTGAFASYQVSQTIHFDGRALYRRGNAENAFQAFDQWGLEAALIFEFAPPLVSIPRNWSVSPFLKYYDTRFDAANPFIDPLNVRHDQWWSTGAIFNAPITKTFGISTAIQYDRTNSTVLNYRLNNLSVMAGPTARF